MKRKMLAAFLAATMVGGLLVGCGNSGDTSGSSKSSSGTTSTASASGEVDASVTKTELGEYTEENPKCWYTVPLSYVTAIFMK